MIVHNLVGNVGKHKNPGRINNVLVTGNTIRPTPPKKRKQITPKSIHLPTPLFNLYRKFHPNNKGKDQGGAGSR